MTYLHKIQHKKNELEYDFKENRVYHWASHHKTYVEVFILFVTGIIIYFAFKSPFVKNNIIKSLKYIKDLGNVGTILFIFGSVVISLLTSNSTIANIAAGLLYGFKEGSIVTIINIYIIAIVSYFIGKNIMREKIVQELNTDKRLEIFKKIKDNAKSFTELENLEFIFLSRLPPVYPFQYISYFWGILDVNIIYYLIGTLGVIPSVLLESYMGSLLENIKDIFSRETSMSSHIQIMIATIIFSAVVTLLIGWMAKKTIDTKINKLDEDND